MLDGSSRAVVHWAIREAMREADVETILQRGRELHPSAKLRVISGTGRPHLTITTTTGACTALSALSPLPKRCAAAATSFGLPEIGSPRPLARLAELREPPET
jgi:hypothetical protein